MDEGSVEIKILRCAYSYLVDSLSVGSVLPEARARGLITVRDYEDCKAEPTVYKQAEKFMMCVERTIIADRGKFESFLSILKQCGQKSIAEYLRKLNCSLIPVKKVQENTGARVYLPDELKVVHQLTDLETAFSALLAKFEAAVQIKLGSCTGTQREVFISTLQNMLEKEDFVDFHLGFKYLKKIVTLFNVKYLKNTVKILPEEEMRTQPDQLLTSYEEELQHFMKTTTVDEYKSYCKEHLLELISSSVEPVTMKLADQWMKRTLDNLKELTCRLLKVPGSRLHLHTITEDCIAVHWLCPVSILPALREAILSATDSLRLEGILQIFIGEEAVMALREEILSATDSLQQLERVQHFIGEVSEKVPQLKILVCGRTGVGKSSLCNSLLGRKVCEVGDPEAATAAGTELEACTKELEELTVRLGGIVIRIFDSPGLQDGNVKNEMKYVEDMYGKCKDVDLVLYCMDMAVSRFTPAERRAIGLITEKFGPTIWERCVFVLTKANLVHVPISMRQAKMEYHEKLFKSFRVKICSLLKEAGVPEDVSDGLHMVAAGYWTNDTESERKIIFASEHCKADPGPPIVPVDFIPELWVTCLETVPEASRIRYLQATGAGYRSLTPNEDPRKILKMAAKDLVKEIRDSANTYE